MKLHKYTMYTSSVYADVTVRYCFSMFSLTNVLLSTLSEYYFMRAAIKTRDIKKKKKRKVQPRARGVDI